ncbi:MAG: nitroreductase family protein [Flammeovirgaceae bacterium]|nr:MAG: nitroreductase family protein [Flammeovirgaceae bacterium]
METQIVQKATSTEFDAPLLEVIRQRRSLRAFADKPVEAEKIRSLFEAARWAPSSVNEQPWRYIYATQDQPELWNRIFETLNEGNRVWVKRSPLLIVSFTLRNFSRNDRPNASAVYDLGAANAFLSLQATALGLTVHQMGGFDKEKARIALRIPDAFEMGVILAVGYPGNPDELPEPLRQRELTPRVRNVQAEFVRNDSIQ